jgi:hypothetical protein
MFSDEAVDPRCDNGQRYRADLEHGIVESADVEFETRSLPNLLVATHRGFAFYVAFPNRSIPSIATCSMSLIPLAPLQAGHTANIFQE